MALSENIFFYLSFLWIFIISIAITSFICYFTILYYFKKYPNIYAPTIPKGYLLQSFRFLSQMSYFISLPLFLNIFSKRKYDKIYDKIYFYNQIKKTGDKKFILILDLFRKILRLNGFLAFILLILLLLVLMVTLLIILI